MQIGIIREGKTPPDSRVPLTPKQCARILKNYPIQLVVQPSPNRCYSNNEYEAENVTLTDDLSNCEILMGVKEIPIEQLIPNKTYFFFSHTIKKQAYNRKLLQTIVEKNIRLIDYETLTNEKGKRLIAFGRFAGMVGAHNALQTYAQRTKAFKLKRMRDCRDYAEAKEIYKTIKFPPIKIVLTGTGRVGKGAAEVLKDMGIKEVEAGDFLTQSYNQPVFTQLMCHNYVARNDRKEFNKTHFYKNPQQYHSIFMPYARAADVMINGIYWDNKAPAFFTTEDMRQDDFNIKVIADVTCDIAPVSSIPSTIKASTIAEPIFGFDPMTESEVAPFQEHVVDMMTIDNLPNEMPRDASKSFGQQFISHILEELLEGYESSVISRATITANGDLTENFEYLRDYLNEE